ncbi:MAG: acyl-CoA dehydratase activase [Pseudomonadota bacterium]
MITAGIDVGAKTVKIAVAQDGKLLESVMVPAGQDAATALDQAWRDLKTAKDKISVVVATGSGRKMATMAHGFVTEVSAASKGGVMVFPQARTVIDVGAEEGRAIKVDESGKVIDFAINEKCAAGAGAFTEAMARALEVSIEQMGRMSLTSSGSVAMNAQCAVFAESELVTLVHSKTPKPDMAKAIHEAIADRIISMVRRVGMQEKVALIGGVARNVGFVDSLNKGLGIEALIPQFPEIVSALGAAVLAAEGNYSKTDVA